MHEYEYERKLMGTDFSVSIVGSCTQEAADGMFRKMSALGDLYEATFSRFREDSELSRLNERGSMRVSALFLGVLDSARALYEATNGHFNPLVQIGRLGYTKDFSALPGNVALPDQETPYDIDLASIGIDRETRTVRLREGQKLDFGGCLKGLVADRMASWADGVQGVIVNVGGDIHTRGRDADDKPFTFFVWDPVHERDIPFSAENASIATSGTYKRAWSVGGKTISHILDKGGRKNPASDVVSATVVARDGATAEGYATMALAAGSEAAADQLRRKNVDYLLITDEGAIHSSYAL